MLGILGFLPGNLKLYEIAFIHKSASTTSKKGQIINNERLEYLGDAILDAIIADFLYSSFPQEDEGFPWANPSTWHRVYLPMKKTSHPIRSGYLQTVFLFFV